MSPKVKRDSIIARTEDGSPMVEVYSMKTEGETLIMDCKALDSMRMNVIINPEDIAKGWPIIKKDHKAIMAFAKKIPAALRKEKKAHKAAGAAKPD
ncbi:MAG: hypothetical protein RR955_04200 [Raoultibacter sp.]